MTEGRDHHQRYSPGERITLNIELEDENGIYDVTGRFVHSDDPKAHITLPGYGEGAQNAKVCIQNVVTANTLPGQYVCEYIQAQDGKGNYSVLRPDITFYVEHQSAPVDDQGPQLKGWSFLPQGAIEVVEMSTIEWNKRQKELDTERQRELTAARDTTEETDATGDTQVGIPETPDTPEEMQGDAQENVHQLIQGKIEEGISEMTEDTGAGGDVGLHIERRMDEIAHDVTEETGAEGDVHLHVERRMNEMAKEMFEED
ncbi:MAG: hypothetical protein M3315_15255 [Actinomycetota bacterium]|nr:hypothetical protein [Actinomycetota bacterium]